MMDPKVGLLAASALVNFLLQTTAEFLVCLLLVRIAASARSRFNLWLTMLLAFLAQWIWTLADVARAAFPANSPMASTAASMPAALGKRIAVAAPVAGTVAQAVAVLLAGYAVIVAWRTVGTLLARIRLARAMRYKSAPEGRVAATFEEVMEQSAGSGRDLRDSELWVLPGLTSPATLGWLKPRVIVPPACQTQDEAELKAVFWHELKHVERRDALWNAMIRACRNLLWFHPAVHHAALQLKAQRELACDAAVIEEHPQSRDVYASCLLRFARMDDVAPERAIPAVEMASGAPLLTMRVKSILSDSADQAAGPFARVCRAAANVALVAVMAATVPGLNILFAAEQSSAAAVFPIVAEATGDMQPVRKRHASAFSANVRPAGTLSSSAAADGTIGTAAISVALPPDEALAAEHRAAMGVLTESSGMEQQTENDGRAGTGLSRSGPMRPASSQMSTTLTSVALDTAERIALSGGHDGDDHHFR